MRKKRVKDIDWGRYRTIVENFVDNDAGTQPFIWLNKVRQPLAYGEDVGAQYCPVVMKGLFHYNYIKTWPNSTVITSGEMDTTNCVLYISSKLLDRGEYLNKYGYWDFDWSEDRFILNGKVYKPSGDTQVSQAHDKAILFFVILQREDVQETNKLLQAYGTDSRIIADEGIYLMNSNGERIRDICDNLIEISKVMDKPEILTQDCRILGYQPYGGN